MNINLVDGCHLISYYELSKTDKGKLTWESCIHQIVDISLQHTDLFFPNTCRNIIPNDARLHQCYVHIENKKVVAYCIVVVCSDIAEYLWGATRKDMLNRGMMAKLYWFIEEKIKYDQPTVERIHAMCASLDSKIVEDDLFDEAEKERRRRSWRLAHVFHHRMNFDFTYKLEDYWGVGYHALLCMKVRANFGVRSRNNCTDYGYSEHSSQSHPVSYESILADKKDRNLEVNQKIAKYIRACLDTFDESFVRNVEPGSIGKEDYITRNYSASKNSEPVMLKLNGFTGLALINPYTHTLTAFADASQDVEQSGVNVYEKFEYSICEPSFLQEIISESEETGYFIYPSSSSQKSKLNVDLYFDYFEKKYALKNRKNPRADYTIFYRKRMGKDGFYSVLYFITPLIPNILWYKNLWQSFSDYSFALTLVIFGYLSSLRVTDFSLRDSEYFDGLMKAVSPSGSEDDFVDKIARISEEITQVTERHYSALVEQNNRAFKSLGHLMKNRCDNLLRLARSNAQVQPRQDSLWYRGLCSLSDSYQAQQLAVFSSLNEIYNEYVDYPSKLNRFFEQEEDSFDLSDLMYQEACAVIEEKKEFLGHKVFSLLLSLENFKDYSFRLRPNLRLSNSSQDTYRLSKAVLSNIFFEIFSNAARHGMVNSSKHENRQGRGTVSIFFDKDKMGESSAIVIYNPVFINRNQKNALARFERLPTNYFRSLSGNLGHGLGVVSEYLSRLNLGEIGERRFCSHDQNFYEIRIFLDGLEISEVNRK